MEDETKTKENNAEKAEDSKTEEEVKQQEQQTTIDTEKIKSEAVSEYLKKLGYDDETLEGIVAKHKQQEEENKTDLEKVQGQLDRVTKELVNERKSRMLAEAKLSALKLGAKKDLVDDLVTVAMSRVTKDKNIDAIISEIKAGTTGSVYFETEEADNDGKNLTGGKQQQSGNKKKEENDDFMQRMKDQRKKGTASSFWKR